MGLKPELELGTEGAEAEYVDPALEMMINPFLCACRSEIGAYLKIYKTVSLFLSPMGLTDKQRVSWRSDRQVSTLPHAIPLIPMDPKWLDTFGYLLYCFVCAQKRIFCATKCATEMAREGWEKCERRRELRPLLSLLNQQNLSSYRKKSMYFSNTTHSDKKTLKLKYDEWIFSTVLHLSLAPIDGFFHKLALLVFRRF